MTQACAEQGIPSPSAASEVFATSSGMSKAEFYDIRQKRNQPLCSALHIAWRSLKVVVVQQLFYKVDVGHQHTTTTVSLKAQDVQSVPGESYLKSAWAIEATRKSSARCG